MIVMLIIGAREALCSARNRIHSSPGSKVDRKNRDGDGGDVVSDRLVAVGFCMDEGWRMDGKNPRNASQSFRKHGDDWFKISFSYRSLHEAAHHSLA